MASSANIVVTCTQRKRLAPAPSLHLRAVKGRTVQERAAKWIDRLSNSKGTRVRATDLYAGEYWSVVQTIVETARAAGVRAHIWICSAGYGLIPFDAEVHSYAATFTHGQLDSIAAHASTTDDAVEQTWWQCLGDWRAQNTDGPRTLADLAERHPKTPLLVAVSPPYLRAISHDLSTAAKRLASGDLLSIISAGGKIRGALQKHAIPCDARLQKIVSGTKISLNVRLAKQAVSEADRIPLRATALRERFQTLMTDQPKPKSIERKPMTDDEVRKFIREALKENSKAKHSPLLRKLRDAGQACEQKRFATLYKEVTESQREK